MTTTLDLQDLREKAERAKSVESCSNHPYEEEFHLAADFDIVLALLNRISSLESERAIYHERLAANDVRAAEQARRIQELETALLPR